MSLDSSRRSFFKTSLAIATTTQFTERLLEAQSEEATGPLLAYVGKLEPSIIGVQASDAELSTLKWRSHRIFTSLSRRT
jgi:hypothetical protein